MTNQRQRDILDRIATTATDAERTALIAWSDRVLSIYDSDTSKVSKLKEIVAVTARAENIRSFVMVMGKELTPSEVQGLATELSALQRENVSVATKLKRGTGLVAVAVKDLAWDNRGLPARMGISAAILAAIAFGGQGAGIAALGTAIGVPLWVVFGAGAAFIGDLYERLSGSKHQPKTTHKVIESTREPNTP